MGARQGGREGGWNDPQQIFDLLIARRKEHAPHEDLPLHNGKWEGTIAKALAAVNHTPEGVLAAAFGDPPPVRLVKRLSDPKEYAIEFADGNKVEVGDVDALYTPSKAKNAIQSELSRSIPFKGTRRSEEWRTVVAELVKLQVEEEVDPLETREGRALFNLRLYLAGVPSTGKHRISAIEPPMDADEASDAALLAAIREGERLRIKGRLALNLWDYERWLTERNGGRPFAVDARIGPLLRKEGFTRERPPVMFEGKRGRNWYWIAPEGWLESQSEGGTESEGGE